MSLNLKEVIRPEPSAVKGLTTQSLFQILNSQTEPPTMKSMEQSLTSRINQGRTLVLDKNH